MTGVGAPEMCDEGISHRHATPLGADLPPRPPDCTLDANRGDSTPKGGLPDGMGGRIHLPRQEIQGSNPGLRRSLGEGNDNPLQYSCLGNPLDRGVWQATVRGIAKHQVGHDSVTEHSLYPEMLGAGIKELQAALSPSPQSELLHSQASPLDGTDSW